MSRIGIEWAEAERREARILERPDYPEDIQLHGRARRRENDV